MPPIQDRPVDWEKLVTENENRLYRAALAVLGDSGEAEDMVQETFLKYLEKAPALESKEHEQAWLMKVLVNGCRDRLRSPWRKRHAPLLDTLPAHMEEEREELIELMALPEKERLVLHLFYYEKCSTGEIAQITGEKEGTVRSRLSRAREKLRKLLKPEEM